MPIFFGASAAKSTSDDGNIFLSTDFCAERSLTQASHELTCFGDTTDFTEVSASVERLPDKMVIEAARELGMKTGEEHAESLADLRKREHEAFMKQDALRKKELKEKDERYEALAKCFEEINKRLETALGTSGF